MGISLGLHKMGLNSRSSAIVNILISSPRYQLSLLSPYIQLKNYRFYFLCCRQGISYFQKSLLYQQLFNFQYYRSEIITQHCAIPIEVAADLKFKAIASEESKLGSHHVVTVITLTLLTNTGLLYFILSIGPTALTLDSVTTNIRPTTPLPRRLHIQLHYKVVCISFILLDMRSQGSQFNFLAPIGQVYTDIDLSWLPLFEQLFAFKSLQKTMYLFYLSHLLIVSAGHLRHLLLQLLTLTIPYLSQSLLLNMHFDPLPFLVLNFEDILLVVFATRSSHKHLVLRLIRLAFGYLGEDKRFSLFFFRVVD